MLSLAASVGFGGGVGCQRARRRACVEGVGCARRAGFRAIFRPQRTVDEALGRFREPPGTRFGGGTRGRHPSPRANASPCSWWSLSSSNRVLDYRLPFAKFLRPLRLPIPTILGLRCRVGSGRKPRRGTHFNENDAPRAERTGGGERSPCLMVDALPCATPQPKTRCGWRPSRLRALLNSGSLLRGPETRSAGRLARHGPR